MNLILIRKIVLKEKISFAALLLSVFILCAVSVVSMSVLVGLQEDQIGMLRDVVSFDIQVDGCDRETLLAADGVTDVFEFADLQAYSVSNPDVLTVRYAENALYENKRFLSKFDNFNPPECGKMSSSFFSALKNEYIYILRGKNNRAVVEKSDINAVHSFFSASMAADKMVFAVLDDRPAGSSVSYGIYTNDFDRTLRFLKRGNIDFRTYRSINSSVWSALMLERYIFLFILFFLFVILFLLMFRLFLRFINENKVNVACLLSLGMKSSHVYAVFTLPVAVLALMSAFAGVMMSQWFTASAKMQKKLFMLLFKTPDIGISFVRSDSAIMLFAAISISLTALLVFALIGRLKKTDVAEMIKGGAE